METKDIVTVIALVLGPVIAVLITLWHQDKQQKRNAKERLFSVLMAHRRANPPTFEWASALNLIDVVFEDNRDVVEKWHEVFRILDHKDVNWGQFGHAHIELLSEIATDLGYSRLRQTDIDRFYAPIAHGTQAALSQEMQTELLRVLKGTQSLRIEEKK